MLPEADALAAGRWPAVECGSRDGLVAGTDARVSKPRSPRGCRCRRRSWCP